ncbi:hypothetical protein [Nitrobacter winogradskyi]|uniref:Uncharacterized protein n=2 Tax=Nitrobacter winogradskyi TaxID=913 RepID=A0ACC6AH52_NITWI|nr:hypothetical protein [Nitrobacter winogradskyi]MCP1998843.1 hypothetical protein [Nitrobacter winogradskyi]GEC14236.1 hypothetical protein NWI01_01280 [Nitrobacter winogradskyi]
MNDDTMDALRNLLAQMRGEADAGRTEHLADAVRLIKAFMLLDSDSRRAVIDTAERLVIKKV